MIGGYFMFVVKEVQLTAPSLSVSLPVGTKVLGVVTRDKVDPILLLCVPSEDKEGVTKLLKIYTFPSGNYVKLEDSVSYAGSFEVPLPNELIEVHKKDNIPSVSMSIHVFTEWGGGSVT